MDWLLQFQIMRKLLLGLAAMLLLGDSCNNGVVGVQDYGTITGRVLDATTNRPIGSAILSVGSLYTATADANGGFTMARIPVGLQTVIARMPGFTTSSVQIRIRKDQTSSLGYIRIVPLTKPDAVNTLPPPPTPTPEVSIEPTWSPPSGSPSPGDSSSPAPAVSSSPEPSATPTP